jgi:thiosulfate/3-mercaptopyruvate sulfurtransferase
MMPDRPATVTRRLLLGGSGASLAAALVGCGGPSLDRLAPRAFPAFADNGEPPLLVDPAALAALTAARGDDVLVLDASDRADYRRGHIPGAVHTFWQETIERDADRFGTVLAPAENQARRLAWLQRHGIDPSRHVVVCEQGDGRRAARIVWFLRFLGHDAATMLDGGVRAWAGAGLPLADGIVAPPAPRTLPAVAPRTGYYEGATQALDRLDDPAHRIVDIRTPAERDADTASGYPADAIPGAIPLPWTALLDPATGRYAAPNTVAPALAAAGIDAASDLLLVGRTGVDANPAWLGLRLHGVIRIACFDPGWGGWPSADNPR